MSSLSSRALKKYGIPGDVRTEGRFMSVWIPPADLRDALPALPGRIYCNNDIQRPLESALRNIVTCGLSEQFDSWDGCYYVRRIRGANNWSTHSWGLSVDVNAARNALGRKPSLSAAFVECFTSVGFVWGGTWKRPDGMHFEFDRI